MFGLFKKKQKSKIEELIEKEGIENVIKLFTKTILLELPTREIAYQFILEEIEAASKGNDTAIRFASNSGISPHEYKDAMKNSIPEVDGPLGPQQAILGICSQLQSNIDLMVEVRTQITDNIMKYFSFGKYEDQQPSPLKGGMRLKDAEVDILFIVRDNTVIYINDEVDHLFKDSGSGDEKLDGRIANFVLTDQLDGTVIEVFVAFDDSDSYTLFTLKAGVQKRLDYVTQAILDYFTETGIDKVLSLTGERFVFDIYSAFKLYRKNGKNYMINNSHTQVYLIDKSSIMRDDESKIQSIYNEWVDENSSNTQKIYYFNSKNIKLDDNPSNLLDYGITHRDEDGKPAVGMRLYSIGEPVNLKLRMKPYIEEYGITKKTPEIETELANLSGYFSEEIFLEYVMAFMRFVVGTRVDKKITLTMMGFAAQNDVYFYNNNMNEDAHYIYSCRQEPALYELYVGGDENGSITEINYIHKLNNTVTKIPLDLQGFWNMFKNIFCDINGISNDDIVYTPEVRKILDGLMTYDTLDYKKAVEF